MSILDRLNRLVRSNISDLSGGTSSDETRRQLQSSLREARREQAELRRDEKQIIESIREARAEAEKWEDRAMLALEQNDESLAREALKAKHRAVQRAEDLREELDEHRNYMQDIDAALTALEEKLDAYRDRRSGQSDDGDDRASSWDNRLRRRRNSSSDDDAPSDGDRRRSAQSSSTSRDSGHFDTGDTFSEFDRMAGKIDEYEADVEAMRELSEDLGGDHSELERRFRQLESNRGSRSDRDNDAADRSREDSRRSNDQRSRADADSDDLADKKRRMDRLNELKDRFDDDNDDT